MPMPWGLRVCVVALLTAHELVVAETSRIAAVDLAR
jgi:hypothetical protein